jgi:hypothetical protein
VAIRAPTKTKTEASTLNVKIILWQNQKPSYSFTEIL